MTTRTLINQIRHLITGLGLLCSATLAWSACPQVEVPLLPVNESIWMRPANAHDAAGWSEPVLVWVGDRELWIADPGPHRCAGLALRRALNQRWPGRAHRLINTHAHPRNVLANSAWPASTPIYALAEVRQQMHKRCPVCLASLQRELGRDWMQGTQVRLPNRILRSMQWLMLGGSRWQVHAHLHAHTEADTSLHSIELNMIFAPSLLSWGRLPDLGRAQPTLWLEVMEAWQQQLPGAHWLGHAQRPDAQQDFNDTHAYLQTLWQTLKRAYEEGRSEHEFHKAPDLLPARWSDAASRQQHLFNVQRVWQLLEQSELQSSLGPVKTTLASANRP